MNMEMGEILGWATLIVACIAAIIAYFQYKKKPEEKPDMNQSGFGNTQTKTTNINVDPKKRR